MGILILKSPKIAKIKFQEQFHILFCKILKKSTVKVLAKRFHLNGNTIGFRSQTQKVKTALHVSILTMGEKWLKMVVWEISLTVNIVLTIDMRRLRQPQAAITVPSLV